MTSTDAIRKAIDALNIQDVYLRACKITMRDDYDPKYWEAPTLTNFAWGPRRSETIEVVDDESNQSVTLWKVVFLARCRLIPMADPAPPQDYEPKPEEVLATIESQFIAEYVLRNKEVDNEALQEFAKHNVAYHVWPYWRAQLSDMAARTQLPRIMLPMHVFKPEPKAENTADSSAE
jgi:hypothetical protein